MQAQADALIEELVRLACEAGFTAQEQESLRGSIRAWLPRFVLRCEPATLDADALESALLRLVANTTRQIRSEIAP